MHRFLAPFALLAVTLAIPACSDKAEPDAAEKGAADPLAALAIEDATASEVDDLPIGTVSGVVTLPPEARVAVTAPFPGAAVRVYVIEGQAVRRGQPLALVRAAQPVQIRGELARAQAELGLAEARAKRLIQLAEEGVIAEARADEARAALAQARASLAEQKRLASLAGAGPDGSMTLSSPIAGRVAHVGVETGGPVDGMEAPFVIEAQGAYQVELQLPARLAQQVKPGMAVQVMLAGESGDPMEIGGRILAVAPSIDPDTRSVPARASIGAAPGIVAGRNVSVAISGTGTATSGVAIPASAITRIDDAEHVFVRKGKAYEARKVTVLSRAGDKAVIGEGLKAGEVVAASSVAELKAMAAE